MRDRQALLDLVATNADLFVLGDPVEEAWLAETERTIGRPLPADYRAFVQAFGGGYLGGSEIVGIIPLPLEDFEIGPDLRSRFTIDQANGRPWNGEIRFMELDGGQTFYFPPPVSGGETQPVHLRDLWEGRDGPYADDFLDFLRRRIRFLRSA